MGVTAIKRDIAYPPFIVRMVTTDSLSTVGTAGYLTLEADNIREINGGDFEWDINDFFLVSTPGGWGFYYITADFTSLTAFSLSTDIVNPPVTIGNLPAFDSTTGNLVDSGIPTTSLSRDITVTVSSAHILSMYDMPFLILAPPLFSDSFYLVSEMTAEYIPNSITYSGGGDFQIQLDNTPHGAGIALTQSIDSSLFTNSRIPGAYAPGIRPTGSTDMSGYVGKGIYISNKTAAFTGGNGTLFMTMRVTTNIDFI